MNPLQAISAALTPLGIVWTLLLLGIITGLHELGHYFAARRQGVKVDSFSVGMGPVLLRRHWRGTEWRISLLPIGGYVQISGMAPEEAPDGTLRLPTTGFAALPPLGRIAVLLAGPLVNLVLAIGLLTATFSALGVNADDRIRVGEVVAGSPAERLGIQPGDEIVALDGRLLPKRAEIDGQMQPGYRLLGEMLGEPGRHTLTVQRTGEAQQRQLAFDWAPTVNGERQLLGIRYGPGSVPVSVPQALGRSVQATAESVPLVVKSFGGLLREMFSLNIKGKETDDVGGPIRITETVSQAAALNGWALVQIATLLNLSLAVFNLLPIPGLDGGRIALVLIEMLRGHPLTFAQEQSVTATGILFLLFLMVFVLVRDVTRFF
ncbi:M50 family metallopeptidase [Deinococcus sp. Marseille-Q6407]|uniref:M50 family metallopeptidase n=1 Tax=Deinococcus sp. Marseille-Q6407 TaxID=2969223 RepID=UPI0021C15546|nr:M50 family metallopeptidase [Deinococcus sp. Marseille-Q6407]